VDVNFTDKIKIKPKISLTTFFFTNFYLINGYKINLNKSLKYGVIYYDRGHTLEKQIAFGSANTIAAIDGFEKKYPEPSIVIPHEMTHTYQFADYYALNYFFEPLHSRMRKNKTMKVLDRFICWDLPFFFLSYHTQNMLKPDPVHYNNFYEFEAQAMATRRYVPR